MKREVEWLLSSLLMVGMAGCCPAAGGPAAQPLSDNKAPDAQVPGGDSGNGGSAPRNPERIEAIRQALQAAYEEPEPERIVDPHYGFDAARDQNASPFDEGLVGTWTVYQLNPKNGTRAVTTLRIDADRNYTYGAYGGTFQYGRPKHYYIDSSTYWGFQEPLGGFYLRRGTRILGQDVIRIYDPQNNRMAGFAVQE